VISLLDSVDTYVIDVWLVFYDRPHRYPFWRWLKPGFKHVEIWRLDRGAWARTDPCLEFTVTEVHLQPPWEMLAEPGQTFLRVMRLVKRGKVREPFMLGPVTCVELAKAAIGLRASWVRTPYALYKYLRKTT
jgi:hypothetical protein